MTGDYMISVIPATTSRITVNFPVIQVIITAALAVIAVVSVCYALYVRRNTARTFERLNDMIDSASEGTFRASVFDESELSALENRFGNFLDSTLTSKAGMQEEKDRIKEMISDISHQTKTPIANLLLHSELLGEDESISPESRESLEIIHFQAEKLKFLVDSLVKLSRLENGIVSLNVSRNSLKELARSVVSELSGKAERKGLQ